MDTTSRPPPVPLRFLIAIFAVAIVVGAIVAYLGFTGALGGPIP